jgi:pyruvate dehydrogenase E2 component (dihydrolipoamide acetyltransferase)
MDGAVPCLKAIADSTFSGAGQAVALRDAITNLSLPVQIIWGRSDQIIPAAHASALPTPICVHVLENAGHMVHMERARDVNKLIQQFIDSN